MHQRLHSVLLERISLPVVLGSLTVAFILAYFVYKGGDWPETYNDFIAGRTTFEGTVKARDAIAPLTFILAGILSLTVGALVQGLCERRLGSARGYHDVLVYTLLPAALWFGHLLTGAVPSNHSLVVAGIASVLAAVFGLLAAWHGPRLTADDDRPLWDAVHASILAPFLLASAPFALNIATARLAGTAVLDGPWGAGSLLGGVSFAVALVPWFRAEGCLSTLRMLLVVGQIPLVLFYFVLVPPAFVSPEGAVPEPAAHPALYVLVGALILLALLDLLRRALRGGKTLSPMAVGGLVICVAVPQIFSPALPSDDYHFGEYIYPWWAYVSFGIRPYLEYTPAHGLINYVPGIISSAFFDGTAASFPAANTITTGLLTLLAFLALSGPIGAGLACVSVLFVSMLPASWLVITLVFGVLGRPALVAKPVAWVSAWLVLGTALVLAAPAQGVALVLATLPAGVFLFHRAVHRDARHLLTSLGLLIVAAFLITLVLPVLPMIRNALRYIIENGGINAVAYGVPWAATWTTPFFEMLRMAWIAVPIGALWALLSRRDLRASPLPLLFFGVGIIFPLAILGYTTGRIDGGPSRPGSATLWLMLTVLPAMLLSLRSQRLFPVTLIAVAIVAALFPKVPTVGLLAAAAQPAVAIGAITDGASAGLTNVGKVTADPEQFARVRAIKDRLDALLKPDETFLDMTGRGASYFYAQRRLPVEVGAPFNMAHPAQQRRSLERLMLDPPPVALLEANNIMWDGRTAALRSHPLYRWVVETYKPVELDGYVYGLRRAGPGEAAAAARPIDLTPANHTDPYWQNGISRSQNQLLLRDESVADLLRVGDTLVFASSGARTILSIDGPIISVDRPLDARADGFPSSFMAPERLRSALVAEHNRILLDRAFRVADLMSLPISWGRSLRTLSAKMTQVTPVDLTPIVTNDLQTAAGGVFIPTGANPFFTVSLDRLTGASAGLLSVQFSCAPGAGPPPRLRVSWSTAKEASFTRAASVAFGAENGWLVIPFDSQPRWLLATEVTRLRFELTDRNSCKQFSLSDASLSQRRGL